ncbi:CDP-diacylglycerol--glycerol-3-phosphate 3-phosphatidyltransferase [Tepidiphilus sp. J10]|uniref:CDP-diacylglycerol--glycerol-3-phosphate 3-phosphatidyltransferase n=1 Tax=Tepidiphilus sp. J10 TaxID=2502185 RepID=UPI00115D4A58|nr:CDP-diacylglycerol--glycerol-3-phosphate 3-phosphatidyltransferase [Tepidiphilus sp. J10]
MRWNIPNLITWGRIALIPVFVLLFYLPQGWLRPEVVDLWATIIFTAAAITDWLDGFLARRLGQQSRFGAFLDPVADKLMVAAALIVLVDLGRAHALAALIIIGREITISALREWMAELGNRGSVAVAFIGKLKTTVQLIAIPVLLYWNPLPHFDTPFWGQAMLWLAALLTIVSMIYYLRRAWPLLREGMT